MDKLMALLETVTLKDIIYFIVGVIGVLSIVVEKAKKIPFHPWTHLFEWIGSSLTKSVDTKLEMIEQQQKEQKKASKTNNMSCSTEIRKSLIRKNLLLIKRIITSLGI